MTNTKTLSTLRAFPAGNRRSTGRPWPAPATATGRRRRPAPRRSTARSPARPSASRPRSWSGPGPLPGARRRPRTPRPRPTGVASSRETSRQGPDPDRFRVTARAVPGLRRRAEQGVRDLRSALLAGAEAARRQPAESFLDVGQLAAGRDRAPEQRLYLRLAGPVPCAALNGRGRDVVGQR